MAIILLLFTMLLCIALAIVVFIALLLTVANVLFVQYNFDLSN